MAARELFDENYKIIFSQEFTLCDKSLEERRLPANNGG